MKRFAILTVLLSAMVVVQAHAQVGKVKSVEIVNTIDNPVPVVNLEELNVNVVNPEPIPVSISNDSKKKVPVSAYIQISQIADYTIMSIPNDKQFILTDIVGSSFGGASSANIYVKEDTTKKLLVILKWGASYGMDSISFSSGIPFSPGTNVVISNLQTGNPYDLSITITGYLLDF